MIAPDAAAARLLDDRRLVRLLALLDRDGEEARVVGGAVRNALLGDAVSDYDITTTATPDDVIRRAAKAGLRTIPTGIAHGTVTVLVEDRPFEVTTLREDVETDGRHAIIRFGRDFAADALRRDFTINAMSVGRDGQIHDYAGGMADIAAGRVRFIGDPATRIREDYLRILRFFRFSAGYAAQGLDAAGYAAAIREREGLARLSAERVRQEVMKLLMARRAVPTLVAMADAGILPAILHGVPHPARLEALIARAADAGPLLRLAALAASVPEDAERLRLVLRLSNADASRLAAMLRARCRLHARGLPDARLLRELLFDVGRLGAIDGLTLAWAEDGAAPEDSGWCAAKRFLTDTPEPRLPFSGADLMARGIPQGRALGDALKRLQAAWIRAGFPQDAKSLSDLLAQI